MSDQQYQQDNQHIGNDKRKRPPSPPRFHPISNANKNPKISHIIDKSITVPISPAVVPVPVPVPAAVPVAVTEDMAAKRRDKLKAWRLAKEKEQQEQLQKLQNVAGSTSTVTHTVDNISAVSTPVSASATALSVLVPISVPVTDDVNVVIAAPVTKSSTSSMPTVNVGMSMRKSVGKSGNNRFHAGTTTKSSGSGGKLGRAAGVEEEEEGEEDGVPGDADAAQKQQPQQHAMSIIGQTPVGVVAAASAANSVEINKQTSGEGEEVKKKEEEEEDEEDPLDAFMRSLQGVDHITGGSGGTGLATTNTAHAVSVTKTTATVRANSAVVDQDPKSGVMTGTGLPHTPVDDLYSRDALEEEDFLRSISSFGGPLHQGPHHRGGSSGAIGDSSSSGIGVSDSTTGSVGTITMEEILRGNSSGSGDCGSNTTTAAASTVATDDTLPSTNRRGINPWGGGGWESDASTASIASHSGCLKLMMDGSTGSIACGEPSRIAFPKGSTGLSSLTTTGHSDEEEEEEEERDRKLFIAAMRQKQFQLSEAERHQQLRVNALTMAPVHAAGTTGTTGTTDGASALAVGTIAGKQVDRSLGLIFQEEGDVMDEKDSLRKELAVQELLEESKKGKELKAVDHSTVVYQEIKKKLYVVPHYLAKLSDVQIKAKREILGIKVRGKGCPTPVDTWEQCGLSNGVLKVLRSHGLEAPFAIQKQSIPAIMCGRDLIAVAKTGSGKTLAFLLPMFRHILAQSELRMGDGPIGLIMAPARELAVQIQAEANKFCAALNLRVACIYGGDGVAKQIAQLKRGVHMVVCTPGRMIDILTLQAGRLMPLTRITMVVLDEADRMFDMGFEPQINMIMKNIRPDRQMILFSATFPQQIEKLARNVLNRPLIIEVGERSCVNKDITQYAEVHEEGDKYMRLLQLLGLWYTKGNIIVFVDSQDKCDSLFQDLLKSGYPSVSLHGGKDQQDRDYSIYEFKHLTKTLMIATSVAGRGLDVPETVCVINYSCPNHFEDYIHRVGRTGRAGRKGTSYTFISPQEEQYAHVLVKAMMSQHRVLATAAMAAATAAANVSVEGGDNNSSSMTSVTTVAEAEALLNADVSTYVPSELLALAANFKQKVDAGDARFSSSSHVRGGKGYTFDAEEENEVQKLTSLQRREYNIEQGIFDKDGKDGRAIAESVFGDGDDGSDTEEEDEERPRGATAGGAAGMGMNQGVASSVSGSGLMIPSHVTLDSLNTPAPTESVATTAATAAAVDTSKMTAVEIALMKAKQVAMKVTATGRAGLVPPTPPAIIGLNSTIDSISAAAAAAAAATNNIANSSISQQLSSSSAMFSAELEFNDYAVEVRKKVTHRDVLNEICRKYDVAIIPKGTYIAPNKTTSNVSASLHLLSGKGRGSQQQSQDNMLMLGYTGITTKNIKDNEKREKEARASALALAQTAGPNTTNASVNNGIGAVDAVDSASSAALAAATSVVNKLKAKTPGASGAAATTGTTATMAMAESEKKLYLLIEGKDEYSVKQAKHALQMCFNDEQIATSKVKDTSWRGGSISGSSSSSSSSGGGGRYSVM